jgi:hypothetical protein
MGVLKVRQLLVRWWEMAERLAIVGLVASVASVAIGKLPTKASHLAQPFFILAFLFGICSKSSIR